MNFISDILEVLFSTVGNDVAPLPTIIVVLLMTLAVAVYEFLVYRFITHRSIYNKQFHVAILVIPFFIAMIVMALQSNIVITLGTIGALAIIRFRTAIKDTTDMVYLLWSVFIGITCGCKLFESCILTSLMVTGILIVLDVFDNKIMKNPFIFVANCSEDIEDELNSIINNHTKSYRLKSRNFTSNGVDYVYELSIKEPHKLTNEIHELEKVKQFSLLEYDSNDII